VADGSKAQIVELETGSEATDIDIKVNLPAVLKTKTYSVAGRIVEAQSRKPLPNLSFHYQTETRSTKDSSSMKQDWISESGQSDSNGDFRLSDVPAGKYKIGLLTTPETPWFADGATFEVVDTDTRGLELRFHQAGSISGFVLLDDSSDAAAISEISNLKIRKCSAVSQGVAVNKDGSFVLSGLIPAIHQVCLGTNSITEGFEILRVERDGVQPSQEEQFLQGIKVGPGEKITGARVVVARYTGVIRGQVKIDGLLPTGGYLRISATPTNRPKKDYSLLKSRRLAVMLDRWRSGTIDSRGRFVIERLPPGEYEINLDAYLTPLNADVLDYDDEPRLTLTRVMTVSDSAEARVDFVLDLTHIKQRKRP
jgi:hypothetical protein